MKNFTSLIVNISSLNIEPKRLFYSIFQRKYEHKFVNISKGDREALFQILL